MSQGKIEGICREKGRKEERKESEEKRKKKENILCWFREFVIVKETERERERERKQNKKNV